MVERTVWGIHAEKTGDAKALFADRSCIAIGWPEAGDLSALKANREKYSKTYPERTAGHVPVAAGQLFRFAHEIQVDDCVVFPAKLDLWDALSVSFNSGKWRTRHDSNV